MRMTVILDAPSALSSASQTLVQCHDHWRFHTSLKYAQLSIESGVQMQFSDLLSRADDELLQGLIGRQEVKVLQSLDDKGSYSSNLRNLLDSMKTPVDLLRDKATRSSLLEMLPEAEAIELCDLLGSPTARPFETLKGLSIRKGSVKEEALFAFFRVPIPADEPSFAREADEIVRVGYGLFDHQRKAIHKVRERLAGQPHRTVLHMPTGSGKTRTAMHLVAEHLLTTEPTIVTWLAYSDELCEQAVEEFAKAWEHLGDRELSVFRCWGSNTPDLSGIRDGFVVAGLSKLHSMLLGPSQSVAILGDRSSLIIFDEAHQAVAPTYKFLLEFLTARIENSKILGLTATPGRSYDDLEQDRVLARFFGGNKVTLEIDGFDSPIDYLVAEGFLARPEFHAILAEGGDLDEAELAEVQDAFEIPDSVLRSLADDLQRNLLIIHGIEELARRHRRIIVFATTVEHARLLATVLSSRGLKADAISGSTPRVDRMRIINGFKTRSDDAMVICNYGVLTTGFDAPQISAALIARPTKSLVLYSQMVGRATRGTKAGGNAAAEIVTVVDQQLPGFRDMAEAFANWEDVWK